ncbi:hypothetical protein EV356DRAFT_498390 [Viridothelium virens]|uniref:Uncharacterized protein n=1 Tax=Viridothelium virens TaxID=1048519 RepID=A0A6A6HEK5_VIRVR|nr:hypothetical protein EV356DRAFT_498390 [Viridothelium virens]
MSKFAQHAYRAPQSSQVDCIAPRIGLPSKNPYQLPERGKFNIPMSPKSDPWLCPIL